MHLFGSTLVKKLFPDFREPNDQDFVTNNKTEWEERCSDGIIGQLEFYYMPCSPDREMTPDELYTVKVSHAIYDIHWFKTMSDIRFLQIKGCKIIPTFLNELRTWWEEYHGKTIRTDFDVPEDDFFSDKVRRKIAHDELHLKINSEPTYKLIVKNDGKAKPYPELFDKLTKSQQIEVCFEEAFVIAAERYNGLKPLQAYSAAQKALVTKLHPEWIADFIIIHWNEWFWNAKRSKFHQNYVSAFEGM